ncbi:E3 ubiquitin-protein ligase MARCH1 isoform X1 [Clarias magur]|uniref:E3 ubiquitin-protein ligase MARCH1 isoform X1 n=1 Tax=Clarias magur TaxID=1594786 RepID=A0A8J4USQ6_CLAMG|nr:E3 ubiquitin-protein ligase MARCH1 isoform X1 [Clarias magur]
MPVHQISVLPVSADSSFNGQSSIRTRNKSKENKETNSTTGQLGPGVMRKLGVDDVHLRSRVLLGIKPRNRTSKCLKGHP